MDMQADVVPFLRRSVGIHRAAQRLAEAYTWKHGQTYTSFKALSPDERAWFLQTAEQMICQFEEQTYGLTKSPDARRIAERDAAIQIQRQASAVAAANRGHELGTWGPLAEGSFDEHASCQRCERSVVISVQHHEFLEVFAAGNALEEGCLAAVEGK